jgi:tail fiber assembly protein
MQNHYFDTTDPLHPYLYSTAANPDSMPPDNALRIGPIHRDGFWPCETDGQWQYLPDHRGKTAYRTTDGAEVQIGQVGELPDGLTLTPLANAHQIWDTKTKAWVLTPAAAAQIKAQQQDEMWARIKAKRTDNLRHGVYVKSVDKWFHTDDNSRTQYLALAVMPKLPEKLPWKTMDNSFVNMTKALLGELMEKMLVDEQADFANAERHKAAMEKADKPLEYDYGDGWTANYEQPAAELEETEK